MSKKHSTVTISPDGTIVPWLSAAGELAYSPDQPPSRKYYFQYGWHMPAAFKDKRIHRYFGYNNSFSGDGLLKSKSFPTTFWETANRNEHQPVFIHYGKRTDDGFLAPIACYDHRTSNSYDTGFILMQQGSYLLVPHKEQPLLKDGLVEVYRGIGEAAEFKLLTVSGSPNDCEILRCYWLAVNKSFSDSEVSFQVAHSFVKRSETYFLCDDLSWYDIAESVGLVTDKATPAGKLVDFHCQSFTLFNYMAINKFGPNFVKFVTPASNIRITSFFAGESEVFVIDPRKLTLVEAKDCRVLQQSYRSGGPQVSVG